MNRILNKYRKEHANYAVKRTKKKKDLKESIIVY